MMVRLVCVLAIALTGCASVRKKAYEEGYASGRSVEQKRLAAEYKSIGESVDRMNKDYAARLNAAHRKLTDCLEADERNARGK